MYKQKVQYLNDIEAGIRKIKDWLRIDKTIEIKICMGDAICHLSNFWVTVNQKTIFSYLAKLESQYHTVKAYEWVDWIDSRLEINLTHNNLLFVSHKFEVERIEYEEENRSNQIDEEFEKEEEE